MNPDTDRATDATSTLGEIAASSLAAIEVLGRFGLDYCCDGRTPLADAAERAGVDVNRVIERLDARREVASSEAAMETEPLVRRIAVSDRLDALCSAHELGAPKEEPAYWDAPYEREGFDPARTVFFDDNADVPAAARDWRLTHVIGIRHPDSSRPGNRLEGFESIDDFHRVAPPAPVDDTNHPAADSKSV